MPLTRVIWPLIVDVGYIEGRWRVEDSTLHACPEDVLSGEYGNMSYTYYAGQILLIPYEER